MAQLDRKYPRVVIICGKSYRVVSDKSVGGGHFSCGKQEIRIGGKYSPQRENDILVHEVAELIMAEKNYRYAKQMGETDSGDYKFVMDHDQFTEFASELAYVMRQVYGAQV